MNCDYTEKKLIQSVGYMVSGAIYQNIKNDDYMIRPASDDAYIKFVTNRFSSFREIINILLFL